MRLLSAFISALVTILLVLGALVLVGLYLLAVLIYAGWLRLTRGGA